MKAIIQLERLERIDQLIRLHATGKPSELATKLNISISTLYELLNYLKDLGASFYYSREKQSYVYEYPMQLVYMLKIIELKKSC